MTHFRSAQEITRVVAVTAQLMQKWGMGERGWMLGKEINFFLEGLIRNSGQISRDYTVYVLRRRLPWRTAGNARLTFPPRGTKFDREYQQFQKKFNVGLDLWPLPDQHLSTSFLSGKIMAIPVLDYRVNIESLQKFIFRLSTLSHFFLRQQIGEIRQFYYADKKRYEQRLALYERLQRGARSKSDKRGMERVTRYYKQLMGRAYPELFGNKTGIVGVELKGIIGFSPGRVIRGTVTKKTTLSRRPEKLIYVFSHFYPSDTEVLPFAKAVLTEGGSALCHAAIVCREHKVPCLVGIRGLMQAVKHNQRVAIDFKRGSVTLQ